MARPGLATVAELVGRGRRAPPGSHPSVRSSTEATRAAYPPCARGGRRSRTRAPSSSPWPWPRCPSRPTRPEQWLDLCAGPGGKAGLLAGLAIERGADLTANEVSEHRADLVRQTLRPAIARAGGRSERHGPHRGRPGDRGRTSPARYDRVLVDAPCTGLGALRRRPEARWRRTPADLADLGKLQRELLAVGHRRDRARGSRRLRHVQPAPGGDRRSSSAT